MNEYSNEIEAYLIKLKKSIDVISIESVNVLMNVLVEAKENGKSIYIMGNGGSSATASHFVCDFNKGISQNSDIKFKFICLNDNIPSLMAYANDMSYDDIFAEQLKTFLQQGDIVIGISGSGNSRNVIKAFEYANNNQVVTIALTGFDGGILKTIAKYNVNIPVNDMQITEDLHMVLDHCMMSILSK